MIKAAAIVMGVVLSQGVVGCAGSAGSGIGGDGSGSDGTEAPAGSAPADQGTSSTPLGGAVGVTGPGGSASSPSSTSTSSACSAPAAGATAYVDHASGADDASHGGGAGACAFRTLTYALAHADGTIALAAGDYPSLGETLPFVLAGRQTLECNPGTPAMFRFDPSAMPSRGGSPLASVVRFAGDANGIDGCAIYGAGRTDVVCLEIATTAAKDASHSVTSTTLIGCGGMGVEIADHVKRAIVRGNAFYGADLAVVVGRGTSGTIESNSFRGTRSADIYCMDSSPNAVTGHDNADGERGAPMCVSCASCPFL